jgi:hypothetical protein
MKRMYTLAQEELRLKTANAVIRGQFYMLTEDPKLCRLLQRVFGYASFDLAPPHHLTSLLTYKQLCVAGALGNYLRGALLTLPHVRTASQTILDDHGYGHMGARIDSYVEKHRIDPPAYQDLLYHIAHKVSKIGGI